MECCSITTGLLAAVVCLLAYFIWKSQQVFKTWEKLGLRGPKPSYISGNANQMRVTGLLNVFQMWQKEFGNVYGIYFPRAPTLVVSDPNVLRDLFVKNFTIFPNRMPQPFLNYKPWMGSLLALRDDHWKHVRSQLSPTFSSGKLKKMMPAIERVVANLVSNIRKKAETGEDVELKGMAGCFAMDVVAGAAFGIEVDSTTNPEEPFNVNALQMINQNAWLIPILSTFPWLVKPLHYIGITAIPKRPTNFFIDIIDLALKQRRIDDKTHGDFLQLLIEAEREGATGPVDKDIDFTEQLKTSKVWAEKGLSNDEIKANALLFFVAGFETVSTALSFTLFLLAGNPEVQKKAQQEVDDKLGKKKVTYEGALELHYIDNCVNEGMRLYTPAFLIDRQAAEDCELGGYQVKKGMRVMVPCYTIHRDPQYWPDPEKYDPDRHRPENKESRHPYAFMPFGHGPRSCIGMRLAQLEIRMAIAAILQNFDISLTEKSVYPPVIKPPQFQMQAEDGLWVNFSARKV